MDSVQHTAMEQRHSTSSRRAAGRRRARKSDARGHFSTAALFATALAVQHASAAVMGGANTRHTNHLQSRQYPSDAPSCAQLCIRVKIEEAADPGLATECDFRTSGYVQCLCASSKFTAAYEQCLLDNCVFPSSLATGRSLFQTFCASSGSSEASQAVSIASSAVASQASVYSETATGTRTSTSTSGTSSMASSSGMTSNTSGASSGASSSGTSGTSTGSGASTQTTGSNTASMNTRSSSSLNAAQIESARANATGVSAACPRQSIISSWTLVTTSAFVLLGSLAVFA